MESRWKGKDQEPTQSDSTYCPRQLCHRLCGFEIAFYAYFNIQSLGGGGRGEKKQHKITMTLLWTKIHKTVFHMYKQKLPMPKVVLWKKQQQQQKKQTKKNNKHSIICSLILNRFLYKNKLYSFDKPTLRMIYLSVYYIFVLPLNCHALYFFQQYEEIKITTSTTSEDIRINLTSLFVV